MLVVGSGSKNGAGHSTEYCSTGRAGSRRTEGPEKGPCCQKWADARHQGQARRSEKSGTRADRGSTGRSACDALDAFVDCLLRTGRYINVAIALAIEIANR